MANAIKVTQVYEKLNQVLWSLGTRGLLEALDLYSHLMC